ncbi:hypothetical protein HMPREF0490_00769 [Lachnospiraceae bacterium 6_1_37FAA]|nr:hypothetical protein HMPREF0490_00769 [Lachnospiraceae bacterium 6_1_37FAA]
MTGYGLVAIVNLLEDWNEKDYGFALYKEEYELLRTANLGNTLVVVNAGTEDRRILGKVKEILSVEEYGKNPTAQVVGVVKMDAYAKREEEEERGNKINELKYLIEKNNRELVNLMTELRRLEG